MCKECKHYIGLYDDESHIFLATEQDILNNIIKMLNYYYREYTTEYGYETFSCKAEYEQSFAEYENLLYNTDDFVDYEKDKLFQAVVLERFEFCPKCGEPLDWETIKERINQQAIALAHSFHKLTNEEKARLLKYFED